VHHHGTSKDPLATTRPNGTKKQIVLQDQATLATGAITKSFPAGTGSRGVLDAAFSRWLMGFPQAWDSLSPGFDKWELMQQVLKLPAEIEQDGSKDTVTL
jgi:hypothetical protein